MRAIGTIPAVTYLFPPARSALRARDLVLPAPRGSDRGPSPLTRTQAPCAGRIAQALAPAFRAEATGSVARRGRVEPNAGGGRGEGRAPARRAPRARLRSAPTSRNACSRSARHARPSARSSRRSIAGARTSTRCIAARRILAWPGARSRTSTVASVGTGSASSTRRARRSSRRVGL